MESAVGIIFSKTAFQKLQQRQFTNLHLIKLFPMVILQNLLTLTKLPHRSHSPPTGSGNYLRLPDSTNTAPQKYRCTASQSSRTSHPRQLYNTHHNSLRCLTAWAPTRARLGSQSLSWLGLGRNMRNQARGSHNFLRLQKRVSS